MKVSVIGLGYVGSVAAAALASSGHDVLGIDVDPEKVELYRQGHAPFYEPGLADLVAKGVANGKLRFTLPDQVDEPLGEVIVIATGTPTAASGGADLKYVNSAIDWIKTAQPSGGIIMMKSTVPPGAGLRLSKTALKDSGFDYISNPEFLREGQAIADWFQPDRMVIGASSAYAANVIAKLYADIDAPTVVTDITSAEMIKYAANAFLATKISFVNEIAALCDRVGALIDDVAEGISHDPRIGGSFLRAGVGYGGSCFPKDVRALDHVALANDHNFELLRSVITVNNRQRLLPLYALKDSFHNLSAVRIGVLGIAFKPETDDVREAPSLDLIRILSDEGADVSAYDPKANESARPHFAPSVRLLDDAIECAKGREAIVVMTEWDEIVDADWASIRRGMSPPYMLFDGRNCLVPAKMRGLGFKYFGVGRSVLEVDESPLSFVDEALQRKALTG